MEPQPSMFSTAELQSCTTPAFVARPAAPGSVAHPAASGFPANPCGSGVPSPKRRRKGRPCAVALTLALDLISSSSSSLGALHWVGKQRSTDEVYAQIALVAENKDVARRLRGGSEDGSAGDGEDGEVVKQRFSRMPHMFCMTLTASDTSTHGSFSVPRCAVEDCFPPLDYSQQRPSQKLVAKDLHGTEWRFCHIYRGRPQRHLFNHWMECICQQRIGLSQGMQYHF